MPVDIVIPQAGESVTSGVVLRWVKKSGDFVKRDETVLELETDKATMEVPAPAAGVLLSQLVKEGDTVKIGASVGAIDEKAAAPAALPAAPAAAPAKQSSPSTVRDVQPAAVGAAATGEVRATPLARKTAEDLRVDLSKLHGTGPGGRIREADVIGASAPVSAAVNGSRDVAERAPSQVQSAMREPMSPIRQRIASRLVQAQHTAAMLTTFNEVDMGAIMDLRKQHKEEFEKKHGVGLGFMGFFVRAAASALRAFPIVNAYLVEEAGKPFIERHDTCDIAVAVSTPKGLVVPVLRRCEELSFADIERGIKELAVKARDGKLTLEEMQGGTFTITNGGIFGSLMSTPILNPPQTAILGMHAIKNRPAEFPPNSGQIALRPLMYLALSYDHRLLDGAQAVQFLVRIKQALEEPQRLLLDI